MRRNFPGRIPVLIFLLVLKLQAESWPQFLGPHRDGRSSLKIAPEKWPQGGSKLLWRKPVGQGFSSPVMVEGRLILHHRKEDEEVVECFNPANGVSLWSARVKADYLDDFGFDAGPRATPAIDGDAVLTLGANGLVQCHELASGKQRWEFSARQQIGAVKGFFGFASSPMVYSNLVLVCLGGKSGGGFVALDRRNGSVVWNVEIGEAGYASPVLANFGGVPQACLFARSGLFGVSATSGEITFEFAWRARSHATVNAASPVLVSDQVFISASYDTGGALLKVTPGSKKPQKVWSGNESLSCPYATPVQVDGYLYGFHGRQEAQTSFRCVEASTGKVRWSADDFGSGTVIAVDGYLLLMHERGELVVLKTDPTAFRVVTRFQILGSGVRASAAIGDGVLFARSPRELVALPLVSR